MSSSTTDGFTRGGANRLRFVEVNVKRLSIRTHGALACTSCIYYRQWHLSEANLIPADRTGRRGGEMGKDTRPNLIRPVHCSAYISHVFIERLYE